jgi:pilus assembly protein FimV
MTLAQLGLLFLLGFSSLASLNAHALALGRLNVLSAIGEPLQAEVDILDLTATESGSLRTSLASAEVYKSMGLNYNPDLDSLQFNLQQSPNGRTVLQLNSSRPVTAAFVDILLEVSWASGKITRNFTLLLTPAKSASSASPVAPVLPMAAVAGEAVGPEVAPSPASPRDPAQRITVVSGDTAGQLAMHSLPVDVSLDQMLLALLRNNPDAFVAGNVNRLKVGAVLTLATASDATTVPRAEARQTIVAQSRDFNAFRQQLASNAVTAQIASSGREATGKVQSSVEGKTPAADKLTLSKGALQGTPAGTAIAEEKLAQDRQAKDAADRLVELSKNLNDLSQLNAAPTATTANAANAAAPADKPSDPMLAAGLAAGTPPAVTAAADFESPDLIDRLLNHPVVLPAATGFLGLLLLWGFIRSRRNLAAKHNAFKTALDDADRAEKAAAEFEEPFLLPTAPTARKEPVEDDPLALAQNEIALGREAQAEVLLHDALKSTPQRLALHIELMDIYIDRGDAASFEGLAIETLTITGGQGVDWEQICTKGQALDPTNPLYQLGAASAPPKPSFSMLDFDLELGPDATAKTDSDSAKVAAKAPPRAKS